MALNKDSEDKLIKLGRLNTFLTKMKEYVDKHGVVKSGDKYGYKDSAGNFVPFKKVDGAKSQTINKNGTYALTPSTGFDGIASAEVTVDVASGGSIQDEKEIFVDYYAREESGGRIAVYPDDGYDGMSQVHVQLASNDDVNVYEVMKKGLSGYVTHEDLYANDILPDGEEILDLTQVPELKSKSIKITDSGEYTVEAKKYEEVLDKVDINVDVKNTTYNRWAAFNWHMRGTQGDQLVCDEKDASNMYESNQTRWKLIFDITEYSTAAQGKSQLKVHAEKMVGSTVSKVGSTLTLGTYGGKDKALPHDILVYWVKPEDFLVIPSLIDEHGNKTRTSIYRFRINSDGSINSYGPFGIISGDDSGNLSYKGDACTNLQDFIILPAICTNTIDLQFLVFKRSFNEDTWLYTYSCGWFMLNYVETSLQGTGSCTTALGNSNQYTFGYGGGNTSGDFNYEGNEFMKKPPKNCWFKNGRGGTDKIVIDKNYFGWFNRYTWTNSEGPVTYKDSTFLAGPGSNPTQIGYCIYKANNASGYRPLAPIIENDIQSKVCIMSDESDNKYYVIIDRETTLPRLVNV